MAATESHTLTGLVSIHDVMPETLQQVRSLITQLRAANVVKITLLVVPGKHWTQADLQQLHDWQNEGLQLAGHGWNHQASKPRTLYHHLHSLLLSRMAAEHLSLDREQIAMLINECFSWFGERELRAPTLYVPPAWALGPLPPTELRTLPFRFVELLSGVLNCETTCLRKLPLTGYEADTAWRALSLGNWNKLNEWRARNSSRPLRIGIHPFDDEYRLRHQMHKQIQACEQFIDYDELFTGH